MRTAARSRRAALRRAADRPRSAGHPAHARDDRGARPHRRRGHRLVAHAAPGAGDLHAGRHHRSRQEGRGRHDRRAGGAGADGRSGIQPRADLPAGHRATRPRRRPPRPNRDRISAPLPHAALHPEPDPGPAAASARAAVSDRHGARRRLLLVCDLGRRLPFQPITRGAGCAGAAVDRPATRRRDDDVRRGGARLDHGRAPVAPHWRSRVPRFKTCSRRRFRGAGSFATVCCGRRSAR